MRPLVVLLFSAHLFAAPPAHAQSEPESFAPVETEEPIVVEPLAPAVTRRLPAETPTAALVTTDHAAPGLRRFLTWTVGDVRAVEPELTPTRLGLAAGFVALLPFLSTQDQDIGRSAPRLRGNFGSPFLDAANELGDPRMQWVSGGLFAATLLTEDTRLQDAAFSSFEAGVYTSLLTNLTKGLVGRSRPAEDEGPFAFRPFSEHRSFPSGHTSLAFALVTPWVVYYPRPWTFGLYAVSTGTAVARLSKERHWVTDVVAGAALGTLTGYWLARRHLRQTTPLEVTPVFGPEGASVTLRYTF